MPQLQEIDPAPFIESGNIQGWLTQLASLVYKYQYDLYESTVAEVPVEVYMTLFRVGYFESEIKPVKWSDWLELFYTEAKNYSVKAAATHRPDYDDLYHAKTAGFYWTTIAVLLGKGVERNAATS